MPDVQSVRASPRLYARKPDLLRPQEAWRARFQVLVSQHVADAATDNHGRRQRVPPRSRKSRRRDHAPSIGLQNGSNSEVLRPFRWPESNISPRASGLHGMNLAQSHHYDCLLDDLVLQAQDAQRTLGAVRRRNVGPLGRARSRAAFVKRRVNRVLDVDIQGFFDSMV
jgi:hypothetical protein